jgi:hypothetical protein
MRQRRLQYSKLVGQEIKINAFLKRSQNIKFSTFSKNYFICYRNTPLKLTWATMSSPPGPDDYLTHNGLLIVAHIQSHSTPLMDHYFSPINSP